MQGLTTHLCKVKVHETECEELQAHREAIEQPKWQGPQCVGCDEVFEVKGEEHRPQGRPQQAQEQEHSLITEALVSVPQDQPELHVDEDEEQGVEDGVHHGQAQSDVGGYGRTEGRQRHGLVHRRRLIFLHQGLHDLHSPAEGAERDGRGGASTGARRRSPALHSQPLSLLLARATALNVRRLSRPAMERRQPRQREAERTLCG